MKILFYAPHSAIWVHAFPEALVAEALQQHGHEIVYFTCGRLFEKYCVCMTAGQVQPGSTAARRNRICRACVRNQRIIRKHFGFPGGDLKDFVEPDSIRRLQREIAGRPAHELFDLVVDEIPVGRIALYEVLIENKKSSLVLTEPEKAAYRIMLANVLLARVAIKDILAAENPDSLVIYNTLYAVNRVCHCYADQRGIPVYFLHAGNNWSQRLQTLWLGRGTTRDYERDLLAAWQTTDFQARPEHFMTVAKHLSRLTRGNTAFIYSPPKQGRIGIKKRFGISPDQKMLLATLSSYDERFADKAVGIADMLTGKMFPTQTDWVEALLRYAVKRPNLFLIIRVHPRDFPNRRESTLSENAGKLLSLLKDLPSNVKVNWPAQGISLYDLAEEVDVVLNAYSSTGVEMSAMGLPVVAYDVDLLTYPADLNYIGSTAEDYFEKIEQALEDGWDEKRIIRTYRWLALSHCLGTISIQDSFQYDDGAALNFFQRAGRFIGRKLWPGVQPDRDCRRRAGKLSAAAAINAILTDGESVVAANLKSGAGSVSPVQEIAWIKSAVAFFMQQSYPAAGRMSSVSSLRSNLDGFCHRPDERTTP